MLIVRITIFQGDFANYGKDGGGGGCRSQQDDRKALLGLFQFNPSAAFAQGGKE